MSKLNRSELEKYTQETMNVALLAVTGLVLSKCPVKNFYEIAEKMARHCDAIRAEIGLPAIAPEILTSGKFTELALALIARVASRSEIDRMFSDAGIPIPKKDGETFDC